MFVCVLWIQTDACVQVRNIHYCEFQEFFLIVFGDDDDDYGDDLFRMFHLIFSEKIIAVQFE